MKTTRIAIHGAAGRMGKRLIALGAADPDLQIVAAVEGPGHPRLGDDAGLLAGIGELGLALQDSLPADADVVVDFSVPEAALRLVAWCREHGTPLVLATTGFNDSDRQQVLDAATQIPLLWAPNMSLAVNLTMKLAEIAAGALKDQPGGVDVEIIERHHRFKEDAPSGTALKFGEIIANVMGQTGHRHGREGRVGARPAGEIGYHAIRSGDDPGQHTIVFGLAGETIELHVAATSRDAYAIGALAAAKFLSGKPAGSYSMNDVLGL